MFDYNLIAHKLSKYLEDDNWEDFAFIKSLNDIILRHPFNRKFTKYKQKIELDETITLVYNFFRSISEWYALYFEESLNNGDILFDKNIPMGRSYYNEKLDKRVIEVPYRKNIEDAFVLVHEVLHDTNKKYIFSPEGRVLFTESLSMYGELLFRDFLIKHNLYVKDGYKQVINTHISVNIMSETIDFELKLFEKYFEKKYFNYKILENLYADYGNDTVENSIAFLTECDELEIQYQQPYIIGELLSCYMYDRFKTNPKYLCELIDTNEIMNEVAFENLLTYLDLDIKENRSHVLLTDDSLKKLEKSYKKELTKL